MLDKLIIPPYYSNTIKVVQCKCLLYYHLVLSSFSPCIFFLLFHLRKQFDSSHDYHVFRGKLSRTYGSFRVFISIPLGGDIISMRKSTGLTITMYNIFLILFQKSPARYLFKVSPISIIIKISELWHFSFCHHKNVIYYILVFYPLHYIYCNIRTYYILLKCV